MSDDGDCCYPIRDTKPMTDHAQRAKDLISYVLESQRQSSDLETLNEPRLVAIAQDYLTQAHAQGRREGMDEIAKGLENEVKYEPSDESYDNEVGKDGDGASYNQGVMACVKWIRTKAKEAGHE